jgi:hypothetical protein
MLSDACRIPRCICALKNLATCLSPPCGVNGPIRLGETLRRLVFTLPCIPPSIADNSGTTAIHGLTRNAESSRSRRFCFWRWRLVGVNGAKLECRRVVERGIDFLPHFYHISPKSPEIPRKTVVRLEIAAQVGIVKPSTVLRANCRGQKFDWGEKVVCS